MKNYTKLFLCKKAKDLKQNFEIYSDRRRQCWQLRINLSVMKEILKHEQIRKGSHNTNNPKCRGIFIYFIRDRDTNI